MVSNRELINLKKEVEKIDEKITSHIRNTVLFGNKEFRSQMKDLKVDITKLISVRQNKENSKKKTTNRCSKCRRILNNGVLEDGKLYCYKCYYLIKEPTNYPVRYAHRQDNDIKVFFTDI